jgi:archaeal flagellar protein FlaJ
LLLRDLHKKRPLMYGATIAISTAVALSLFFLNAYLGVAFPFPITTMIILGVIGVFVFPGLAERSYGSWRRKIDDNIPNMLSDVSGSVRTGFDMTRALELAAENDYGPLTEQLRIDKIQLSWRLSFEEVMVNQIKRLDSQLAKRTFTALMQANKSGGNVQDVLDTIQRHATDLYQIDKERRSALRPYITTTYIAVGIFLAISVVPVARP